MHRSMKEETFKDILNHETFEVLNTHIYIYDTHLVSCMRSGFRSGEKLKISRKEALFESQKEVRFCKRKHLDK